MEKKDMKAKFTGQSDEYENGTPYELKMWEEEGMVFISMPDGSKQVAYDSLDSLKANWEIEGGEEEVKDTEKTKEEIRATFKGQSDEYDNGMTYVLKKWEEDGMIFISLIDGRSQVAYDSIDSLKANWDLL